MYVVLTINYSIYSTETAPTALGSKWAVWLAQQNAPSYRVFENVSSIVYYVVGNK